jgi:hypothetical protein
MLRTCQRILLLTFAVPAAWLFPAKAEASTNLVLRATVSALASLQSDTWLFDQKIANNDLINLALGRTPPLALKLYIAGKADVPLPLPNEVLALAINCDTTDVRLIVFDTLTASNLATLATLNQLDHLSGRALHGSGFGVKVDKVTQLLLAGPVEPTGTILDGLTGGWLTLRLAHNCTTNQPLTQVNGTFLGSLHIVAKGQAYPLILRRGTVTAKGPSLGMLIDPPGASSSP